MNLSSQQLAGAIPIFLLEIDFHGQIWRFSTYPRGIDGLDFIGGLADFEYKESSNILGVDIESNSLSVQLDFIGLDLIHEWRKGRTLEGCSAEFSYMLMKADSVIGSHDDRIILLDGIIQNPVFGDPLESLGVASFTIERKPYDTSKLIINEQHVIDNNTFVNHDQETAGGKFYPIVIGQPGVTRDDGGTLIKLYSTPTYNIQKYGSGNIEFIIAGHEVVATQVRIKDGAGNDASYTVQKGFDGKGQLFSFITVPVSGPILYPNKPSISNTAQTPNEFWIFWEYGGGLRNPYGESVKGNITGGIIQTGDDLSGGADVCRWALSRANIPIDYGAWGNIAPILNKWRFAGYINEPVSCWDWLNENILPYLPIEIRSGHKGLRPVLAQLYAYDYVLPVAKITAGVDFNRISAIETTTDTSEILNSFSVSFAKQGHEQKYACNIRIGPNSELGDAERNDIFSQTSINKYGIKEDSIETNYIYDRVTAFRVAHLQVKSKSFPLRVLRFEADMYYGFLKIGDVIELSSDALYLEDTKCMVISKTWSVYCWTYEIGFIDNHILIGKSQ